VGFNNKSNPFLSQTNFGILLSIFEIAAKALSSDSQGKPLYTIKSLSETYKRSESTVIRYRDEYMPKQAKLRTKEDPTKEPLLYQKVQRLLVRMFLKDPCKSLRDAEIELKGDL